MAEEGSQEEDAESEIMEDVDDAGDWRNEEEFDQESQNYE